jgi:hypothetical protein
MGRAGDLGGDRADDDFNFTGPIEAASGLPQDRPPDDSRMPEMRAR